MPNDVGNHPHAEELRKLWASVWTLREVDEREAFGIYHRQVYGAVLVQIGVNATPAGVLIALDREEKGRGELSATQEVSRDYGLPVTAIATLSDILATLRARPADREHVERIEEFRRRYGV